MLGVLLGSMDPLKLWLMSNKLATECGIGDLGTELGRLDGFQSVSFTHGGKAYSYTIEEIRVRAQYESGDCPVCRQKDIVIDSLRVELGRPPPMPLLPIVRDFVERTYERTPYRIYSRKRLLNEVNAFLRSKYRTTIFPWEKVWHVFLREELGDRSTQYRPLRLRLRSDADGENT
jgi:hypothetical protein